MLGGILTQTSGAISHTLEPFIGHQAVFEKRKELIERQKYDPAGFLLLAEKQRLSYGALIAGGNFLPSAQLRSMNARRWSWHSLES